MTKLAPTNRANTTPLVKTCPKVPRPPSGASSHRRSGGTTCVSIGTTNAPAPRKTAPSTGTGAKRSNNLARERMLFQTRSDDTEWASIRRLRIARGTRTSASRDRLDWLGTR
jgi:hypothetical protein